MQLIAHQLGQQFAALSAPELFAVVMAIAYLLLAIRQNIWCWFCAAVSTAIYVYLFFEARLYMESLLNGFYFLMAAYGWQVWRSGGGEADLPVSVWPVRVHAMALLSIAGIATLSGYLLQRFTDAALPYVDSMTTFAAMWATFLVARKVLENWWYWLVIDAASVAIYWSRDLQLTALLFVVYLVLIPFGLISWRRSLVSQRLLAVTA
ncbi:MAG: nicotinamide riboside transporter PnuC [Gammaproteobacteria bacterium]|nr:nicotinamide riboside transporter PnuC [Gammaproteobacteria bacterium]MDH4314615.1 nicotinamide riboside transporter PnuC [Gammaproteobacteria bacterium]MDH5212851.1 nicotinamide riboside transporter PnuC [Gammaproteobacteria bacterium]MDH5500315.1 nicotinamide riboside transporter PnuC [Gammaproteobacteria bacterium]